jgi:hypothetical protein
MSAITRRAAGCRDCQIHARREAGRHGGRAAQADLCFIRAEQQAAVTVRYMRSFGNGSENDHFPHPFAIPPSIHVIKFIELLKEIYKMKYRRKDCEGPTFPPEY